MHFQSNWFDFEIKKDKKEEIKDPCENTLCVLWTRLENGCGISRQGEYLEKKDINIS